MVLHSNVSPDHPGDADIVSEERSGPPATTTRRRWSLTDGLSAMVLTLRHPSSTEARNALSEEALFCVQTVTEEDTFISCSHRATDVDGVSSWMLMARRRPHMVTSGRDNAEM